MTVAFMELSSFDDSNPQGYDDAPDFDSDIWALLLARRSSIGRVVSWSATKPSLLDKLRKQNRVDPIEVQEYGPMGSLSEPALASLRERSNWGGDFSVFFITSDYVLVRELILLYRRSPRISQGLAASRVPSAALEIVQRAVAPGIFVLTFGHDGDPICIFGENEALSSLAQR